MKAMNPYVQPYDTSLAIVLFFIDDRIQTNKLPIWVEPTTITILAKRRIQDFEFTEF